MRRIITDPLEVAPNFRLQAEYIERRGGKPYGRNAAQMLNARWTPTHSFDLKTKEGRASRLAQLKTAWREQNAERRPLEAAAKAARKHNRLLHKARIKMGDWHSCTSEQWGHEHPDTDKLYRWERLKSNLAHLGYYIRNMERSKRGAGARHRRKLRRDRKRTRQPSVKAWRRARDRAAPPMTQSERDARNALRRARYAAQVRG